MDAMSQAPTGMRVEFIDRLRGYRFAAELRKSGAYHDVHVWHTLGSVVIDLPAARGTDARRAILQAESGGIVEPSRPTRLRFSLH